jgi:hypothetical protein
MLRGSERHDFNRSSLSWKTLCAKEISKEIGRSERTAMSLSRYAHALQLVEVLDDSSNAAHNAGKGI